MPTHEEQLLAILEKVGQPEEISAEVPSVLDADAPEGPHLETSGPSEDPNDIPEDLEGPDQVLAPITRKNLFVHHDTHPVIFDLALLAAYQTDWFEWEPVTLWKEIMEDFRVPSISDHAKAKIQAIKTLHINEWFFTKWEVFCWITQALNNNLPDFQVIQKPSLAQLLNAVDIATMVRKDVEFSLETQDWVAAAVVEEGVFYAPKPIEFCQDEIVELLGELQVPNFGQVIEAVRDRLREIMSISSEAWAASPEPILQETQVDIQVAKLKVACDYLALRRRQLKEQLRLLK